MPVTFPGIEMLMIAMFGSQLDRKSIQVGIQRHENNLRSIKVNIINMTSHSLDELTHCGLVTPYGDRDLGQQWLG